MVNDSWEICKRTENENIYNANTPHHQNKNTGNGHPPGLRTYIPESPEPEIHVQKKKTRKSQRVRYKIRRFDYIARPEVAIAV
jgi:hypothetical protein